VRRYYEWVRYWVFRYVLKRLVFSPKDTDYIRNKMKEFHDALVANNALELYRRIEYKNRNEDKYGDN